MDFGRKVKIGNFEVVKFTRAMRKKDMEQSRDALGVPKDLWKHLTRSGVPFIKVSAVGGLWSVEFAVETVMYFFIEDAIDKGFESVLQSVFTLMYADMSVVGDAEYWSDKREATMKFVERQKARVENPSEEKEDMSFVEHLVNIGEMADAAVKEMEEGGGQ